MKKKSLRKRMLQFVVIILLLFSTMTAFGGTPWEDCGVSYEDYAKAMEGTKIIENGIWESAEIIKNSPSFVLVSEEFVQSTLKAMYRYLKIINEVIEYYPCNGKAYLLRAQIYGYLSLFSPNKSDQKNYANLAYYDAEDACEWGYDKACDNLKFFIDLMNR